MPWIGSPLELLFTWALPPISSSLWHWSDSKVSGFWSGNWARGEGEGHPHLFPLGQLMEQAPSVLISTMISRLFLKAWLIFYSNCFCLTQKSASTVLSGMDLQRMLRFNLYILIVMLGIEIFFFLRVGMKSACFGVQFYVCFFWKPQGVSLLWHEWISPLCMLT